MIHLDELSGWTNKQSQKYEWIILIDHTNESSGWRWKMLKRTVPISLLLCAIISQSLFSQGNLSYPLMDPISFTSSCRKMSWCSGITLYLVLRMLHTLGVSGWSSLYLSMRKLLFVVPPYYLIARLLHGIVSLWLWILLSQTCLLGYGGPTHSS